MDSVSYVGFEEIVRYALTISGVFVCCRIKGIGIFAFPQISGQWRVCGTGVFFINGRTKIIWLIEEIHIIFIFVFITISGGHFIYKLYYDFGDVGC